MAPEVEKVLRTTPLREITSALLAEYTNSAHAWDDAVAREMRYFLPRYLELIAANDPPDDLGLATRLRRLDSARWRDTWPAGERELLDRYFDVLLTAAVARLDLEQWPVDWKLAFDVGALLTLVITAGGDVDRVLAAWDVNTSPAAAIHMAALRAELVPADGGGWRLNSSFLEDHPAAAEKIGRFLARPVVSEKIEAAFFAVTDERLQRIASDGLAFMR